VSRRTVIATVGPRTAVVVATAATGPAGSGGQTLIVANDTDITVPASPGTTVVLYETLTAPRVVTLPPASSAPMTVIVKDVNAHAGSGALISFAAAGGDSIVGAGAAPITATLIGNGYVRAFANDGITTWADAAEPTQISGLIYAALAAMGVNVTRAVGFAGEADIVDIDTLLDLSANCVWNSAYINSLTHSITITLPPTSGLTQIVGRGELIILDCSGNCAPGKTISVACDPTDQFLVPGTGYVAGPIVLDAPCASLLLHPPNIPGGLFGLGQWQVISRLP
jgi:hypothetical protein